jgi:hypothetical protein
LALLGTSIQAVAQWKDDIDEEGGEPLRVDQLTTHVFLQSEARVQSLPKLWEDAYEFHYTQPNPAFRQAMNNFLDESLSWDEPGDGSWRPQRGASAQTSPAA